MAFSRIHFQKMDEGYIKFNAQWKKAPPLPEEQLREISRWRDEMYRHRLIGVYGNGIGYGNISNRFDAAGRFIITGSATGHLPTLSSGHFTTVTGFDVEKNTLSCWGPIVASSESMSHAVIYRECPEVNGVIHVHHEKLWEFLLHKVPATDATATYGSPEMASSIIRLLKETDLRQQKIFVMEGHPEGVFSFGENLEEAAEIIFLKIKNIP